MTTAATAPPETPVGFFAPPVEPARTGFDSADGVIAGGLVVPKRGAWEPVLCGGVVPGVNVLVVVKCGNDDDVVDDVTDERVGVGTRLGDGRERVGIPTTGETCTTVGSVNGPCVLEEDTPVGSTGGVESRGLGPSPGSS